ncbi:unnamed protein product [Mytilus coruscus]|nr:unnamed protein product [Mytilus coruscus]
MLQPVVEDNRKIMVAQMLVDPFEKVIPFRLVNMEDHPVQLKRNYLIGELHPVTNITQFDDIQNSTKPLDDNTKNICKLHNLKMNMNLTDEPVCIPDDWNNTIPNCKAENSLEMNDKCRNEAEIPALPDHLKDLFERSSKNIANEETKRKLADMLLKNSKAFAGFKTDVGTCSFIKHRIDTAGAAPRCMELIFRGLQWQTLLIYLDDIIIFSSDEEDHLKRLDEVFSRLINAGLKLKPSKCDLLREEMLYLGHVVEKEGINPNPKIVQSVHSWKVPSTAKEIQQFLGLCN